MQFRDDPLQIAVPAQRAFDVHFILLHVAGDFELRHLHLPAFAVQTAARFDRPVEFRRPVRHLFGGVDPFEVQLAAPADRFLPVEQRRQFGFAFQRRHGEFVEVNLLLVTLRIQGNVRRR
ncbi:hypothetical protein D3C72_1556190 [compost metagenome]